MLEKYNYIYDSSIMPAKTSMYGNPNADKKPYKITSENLENNSENGKLWEFPLMVTKLLGKQIPAAGGFYLRTLPLYMIKNAIKNYEKEHMPACFYVHSWELTPELMPRIPLSQKNNFITYHNIEKTLPKLDQLLSNFNFTSSTSLSLISPINDNVKCKFLPLIQLIRFLLSIIVLLTIGIVVVK